jgi:small redox-active disulfide protein 2
MIEIKVLGPGCPKCKKLYEMIEQALSESGVEGQLSKVDNVADIMSFGVMMTPALVIDGEVKCVGKIPDLSEVRGWLADC